MMSEESDVSQRQDDADQPVAEEVLIKENLDHLEDFVDKISKRGSADLSFEVRDRIGKFKDKLGTMFSDFPCSSQGKPKVNGAIPKVKTKYRPKLNKEDTTSGSSSKLSSADESSASVDERERKPLVKSQSHQAGDKPYEELLLAIQKLDSRGVPRIKQYEENTGDNLLDFLKRFEHYCENNFRCDKDLWLGELERHLTGKTLQVFQAVRGDRDSYDEAVIKFKEYYMSQEESRTRKDKARFRNARQQEDESLFLYSSRLEKLYRTSRGNSSQNYQNSSTLCEKFTSSLRRSSKKAISSHIMNLKLNGKQVTWDTLKQCARLYDQEKEDSEEVEDKDLKDEEIVIAVGQRNDHDSASWTNRAQVNRYNGRTYYGRKSGVISRFAQAGNPNHSEVDKPSQQVFRTSENMHRKLVSCDYCSRLGHEAFNCRYRLGSCFVCGATEHFVRDCPKKRSRTASFAHRSNLQQNSANRRLRNNSVNLSPANDTPNSKRLALNYQPLVTGEVNQREKSSNETLQTLHASRTT